MSHFLPDFLFQTAPQNTLIMTCAAAASCSSCRINYNSFPRFRDEGQLLTISNVTKADNGKTYKCSLAIGEPMPSIYLTLVVHPSDWEAPKTTPSQQPRSVDNIQNLPSTGTSQDNSENIAACIELSFIFTFLSFGLMAYHLHFILPR